MIPTVALWMSFERDALPLAASVAYFRVMNPGIPVYISHDSARPIPNEILDYIKPEFVGETIFETRTKLFGWEPLKAVLESVQKACEVSGAKSAVKIDSDTLVDLAGWYSPDIPWVGAEGGTMPLGRGMACGIQPGTARAVWHALTTDRWFDPSFIPPEDSVIYSEAVRLFPNVKLYLRRSRVGALMVGYDWRDTNGFERYRDSRVVTFGNRGDIPGGRDGCESVMAAKMCEFTAWRTGVKIPDATPPPIIHFLSVPKNGSQSVRHARIPGVKIHGHEIDGSGLSGEIIAIHRDPVDRFESAFWYQHSRRIRQFQSAGITTPPEFAAHILDHDPAAMALFTGNGLTQTVGGEFIGCDFAFCPQSLWLKNATAIIEFDDFPAYFQDRFGIKIPKTNQSKRAIQHARSGEYLENIRRLYPSDFQS